MSSDPGDRGRGILRGLAAGDRIGGPLRMALCLAESLIARHRFDRDDILERYLAWWRAGGFDTGPVADRVFHLIQAGVSPDTAVIRTHEESGGRTAGCNPAHRAPSLAMAAFLSEDHLPSLASQDAHLTHRDPLAGDVSAAVVVLCRALIRGADWSAALQEAAAGRAEPTRAALLNASDRPPDRGGFAPETLRAAVSFLSAYPAFDTALEAALAFAGPANYCPVLVGAIAGARDGASSIPAEMLTHCDILERVQIAAETLAETWNRNRL